MRYYLYEAIETQLIPLVTTSATTLLKDTEIQLKTPTRRGISKQMVPEHANKLSTPYIRNRRTNILQAIKLTNKHTKHSTYKKEYENDF